MADPLKALRQRAAKLGFTAPYVVDLASLGTKSGEGLREAIAADHHASMEWLAETAVRRSHPQNLWPDAKSAVLFGMNYGPETDPMSTLAQGDVGTISVYARGRDYHDLMKGRLKELAGLLARDTGEDVKVFVDTAPVLEKVAAAQSGIGWQGKNTHLVSREYGSWLFLGEIYTDLDLKTDRQEEDHCGSCNKCLSICPTDAFPSPYVLDAKRCISYLTIEYHGHIAEEFRAPMGNRIYGCDDCIAICPWNKFAEATSEENVFPRIELTAPRLADLAELDDATFRQVFSGSPVKRIGRDRFIRNVLIGIGNCGDKSIAKRIKSLLKDTSPYVRAMAVWAMKRLLDRQEFEALRLECKGDEPDTNVLDEWQ